MHRLNQMHMAAEANKLRGIAQQTMQTQQNMYRPNPRILGNPSENSGIKGMPNPNMGMPGFPQRMPPIPQGRPGQNMQNFQGQVPSQMLQQPFSQGSTQLTQGIQRQNPNQGMQQNPNQGMQQKTPNQGMQQQAPNQGMQQNPNQGIQRQNPNQGMQQKT